MWAQLAMAGAKSLQDEQNRKRELESQIINQKYSAWTGQRGQFGGKHSDNSMNNMIQGAAAGLMADAEAAKAPVAEAPKARDAAGGVTSFSSDYLSMPEAGKAKSSFASVAQPSRSPATTITPEPQQAPSELPGFMQGSNPWLSMKAQPQGPGLPHTWDQTPAQEDPTQKLRGNLWSMIPSNIPLKQGW